MVGFQRLYVALAAALLLGLWLQWPSLHGGFRGDDYVQWAMFRGEFPAPRHPLDLFSFAAGTPGDNQRLVDFGYLPWWSHPALRLRMLRPLASALMAFDFAAFDKQAVFHHAHSLLWFGLLLMAAGRVLWRVLPPSAATLSLLMLASAPCHTMPVGWLANRSSLVGCTLALLALDLQLRSLASGRVLHKLAVAVLVCLALACGEYGLVALAYVVAASVFAGAAAIRTRIRNAWPVYLPIGAYLALHSLVGSDIVHSAYYVSPQRAPLEFLRAACARVPVLVADLWFGLPSLQYVGGSPWRRWLLDAGIVRPEVWVKLPPWTTWHVAIGYLACVCAGAALWLLRRAPSALRPPTWLVVGAFLSLLPCAGSLPEDRLLIAASLGTFATVACLLLYGVQLASHAATRLAAISGIALCLLGSWIPISGALRSYDDVRAVTHGSDVARTFCLDADMPAPADAAHTRVYLLAAPDFNSGANLPWMRLLERGQATPLSYRRLSASPMPFDLTRPSDRVIELRLLTNEVFGSAVPALYRDASAPVRVGEQHALPGLQVTVLQVFADNPTRLRFEFDRSVDDDSLWFLIAGERGLRHQKLPAIGEKLRVLFAQYRDLRVH
ncbi:MAG: hypothetical protein RL701_5521 [Pseudomonadota bacterium]